jgi:hypothetical protein
MSSELHVDNIGTRFLVTIQDDGEAVNISNASSITMVFKKPDDSIVYRSGILLTNGSDGQVYYDTISGDLDEAGLYKLQARVVMPSGTYYTDVHTFQVHCNL